MLARVRQGYRRALIIVVVGQFFVLGGVLPVELPAHHMGTPVRGIAAGNEQLWAENGQFCFAAGEHIGHDREHQSKPRPHPYCHLRMSAPRGL